MLWTFGHGTASLPELAHLLCGAGIGTVVDVRTAPGSRRNPDVARESLRERLPGYGIGYRWDKRLGGFRKLPHDSPDHAWRNEAFRAYAAHMRSEQFLAAIDDLLDGAAATRTAVMCSESVWWRCHRRLIADFVRITRAVPVCHLLHRGEAPEHEPAEAARLNSEGLLVYDAGQRAL